MLFNLLPTRLVLFLILSSATSLTTAAWEQVTVNDSLLDTLFGQNDRPSPSCSGGPQPIIDANGKFVSPLQIKASPSEFVFFVERNPTNGDGFADNLLLYLSGGGACWDAATCVGSALTPFSSYFPAILDTADGLNWASADPAKNGAGGILTTRSDNPYKGFAKVYVPYCTGDVHIGSSDTNYTFMLPLPPELGMGDRLELDWTIHHRGFDNLRVVLKWLQQEQQRTGASFAKITVAGSSAGGYGALLNFPVIRAALGEEGPSYSIIVDSSNGVLTNGFRDRAFGSPDQDGVWGARQNLDPDLQPVLDADASSLWVQAFQRVGSAYPDTRISQSTAAYDAVQALVLRNMQAVDNGSYNPFAPPSEAEITATAVFDWSPKARLAMLTTAFSLPNYRYYLGAGPGHVHLLDPPPEVFPFPTTNYFAEQSARNVRYTDWLDDMLNNPRQFLGTDWRNLSCFPACLQLQ